MALAHYQGMVTDLAGNVVAGASVEIRQEGALARLASIKATSGGAPKTNPITADSNGYFNFWAEPGWYRIKASKVIGAETWTREWTYVCIGEPYDRENSVYGGTPLYFDDGTSDADPGDGAIRFNNADHAAATIAYIDDLNIYGSSIVDLVNGFDATGGTNHKGTLRFEMAIDRSVWREYVITGNITDAAGYLKIPLEHVDSAGDIGPGDALVMLFTPAGPGKASEITNTPAGGISATTVQGALNELDTGKAPLASPALTGNPTAPTQAPGNNSTRIATTAFVAALGALKQDLSQKGQANGYAGLDINGKVPLSQIAESLIGAMNYQGNWNAATNTPTIPAAASGNKGHYYTVSVEGATNVDGITDWKVGDWIVSNGTAWDKIDSSDQVVSVAGLMGVITETALKIALGHQVNMTDNRLLRADGAEGIQQTGITVNDNNDVSGVRNLSTAGSVAFTGDISPTALSANQNNYNPTGLATVARIRQDTTTNVEITGLAGGADGRQIVLHNISTNNITLKKEDGSSTAANRFLLSDDLLLQADQSVLLEYDATSSRWRSVGGGGGGGGAGFVAASQADQEAGTSSLVGVTPSVQQFHPSAAKVWLARDLVNDVTIASYNVSSVTDNANGDMTVNFDAAFSSDAYAAVGFAQSHNNTGIGLITQRNSDTRTAAAIRVVQTHASNGSLQNGVFACLACFGDQ